MEQISGVRYIVSIPLKLLRYSVLLENRSKVPMYIYCFTKIFPVKCQVYAKEQWLRFLQFSKDCYVHLQGVLPLFSFVFCQNIFPPHKCVCDTFTI